ncbi:hypothetical protein EPR50_G00083790 [Perca flavescens]|uniref:Transcription factor Iwr1 domain-containing protein n=1 Tax=Perca flavescens TaxID=8167 RepID=A0A484D1M1_PERFV|nr:hypothetical protein EPR50_G00083790 [Perca flavescens]
MSFSRLRSPAWEGHLQIGAAGVSDNDNESGSSQNLAEVFPQLIRAINLPRYIADDVAPEVEVEEGEYIAPLLYGDDDDEEDGSVFQYEDGEMSFYALSSDEEEEEDDEMLDDSGYDSMLDEEDDNHVGHRSPLIQRPRLLVLPPVSPRLPPVLPTGAPLHLHPSFGIQLLFLRD